MKNKIIVVAVIVLTAYFTSGFAQAPDTLWTHLYGAAGYDFGYAAEQTTDGGYIFGGYTSSYGAGSYDLYLVKTDANGDTVWTGAYGGLSTDYGYAAQQTSEGGYIIAGYTMSFGAGGEDFYVVKTNSTGDTIWTRTYGGVSYEQCYSLQQTPDGGYIFSGRTNTWGAGSYDIYLVKTDANGDTLWTGVYGGAGYDMGNGIQLTSDGGYIITGQTTSYGAGGYDLSLTKVNSSGALVWAKYYGGTLHDYGYNVQPTSDGGYIVAGATRSYGAGNNDFYVVKTDANGDSLWTSFYGGISTENGYWIQETSDGGYVLVGQTNSFGAGGSDIWVVKTNSSGDTLWTGAFGGTLSDYGRTIQETSDGGFIIGGYSNSWATSFDNDLYLIRLESNAPSTPAGYLTNLTYGPPDWGYRLHWVSGSLSQLVFTNFCIGTVGSLSGSAAASWSMLPNGDGNDGDSIIFVTSCPLTSGTIDTFWLSHPTCGDVINWQAGDSTGSIEGPLPVELTTFEAIAGDGQVRLYWKTESETDNDHFILYKRILGNEDFLMLVSVPGHGTTVTPQEYEFIDHAVLNGVTYEYKISDVDVNGMETIHEVIVSATPSLSSTAVPSKYSLSQNWPNPFNSSTLIKFGVKDDSYISLKIFDLLGREVASMVEGNVSAGSYTVSWDATDYPSGIYLYQLKAGNFNQVRKLILLK